MTGLGSTSAARGGGLAVRVAGDGSGLWFNNRVDGSTAGCSLYRQSPGVAVLARRTDVVPRVGDRLRVTVSGSTVTAFVDGAQVVQVSSTLDATSTRAGLFFDRSGVASRFDDVACVA